MHAACARIVTRCNELLCIFPNERCLVIRFFEGAGERCVAVLNIKATRETHIPIVEPLVYIRKVRITFLNAPDLRGDWHAAHGW